MGPKSNAQCPLRREEKTQTQRRKLREDEGQHQSDAATSPGTPEATSAGKDKTRPNPPLEPSETTWPRQLTLISGPGAVRKKKNSFI